MKTSVCAVPSPARVIALVSLPIFIGALDLTVVSAVLPHVVYDLEIPLQTGLDEAAWIVSGYLLAYGIAMTFMGRLSDIFGRRKVFLLALAVFGLGSFLVAVADTWLVGRVLRFAAWIAAGRPDPALTALWTLVGARMVQAFGGGAMVPVGMALVGDLYPTARRAIPLGVIAAVDTAGWVVGHLYGGILTRYFDWRLIFWLNLPVCLLAFIWIARVLSGLPRPIPAGKMDWLGALLIAASLALVNIGLGGTSHTEAGLGAPGLADAGGNAISWGYLAAAAICFSLFILRQQHARFPLLPLGLFRRIGFAPAVAANFLVGVSLFVAIANVPLFINMLVAQTLEQGAWDSGWMLSALTVPMALAAVPGGRLAARLGYRLPSLIGLSGALIGFWLMAEWQRDTSYTIMALHLCLTGIGLGLTLAPVAAAAINAAPADDRGTASALVILFRLVGMTLGVSGMAAFGIWRAEVLSAQWLPKGADLMYTVEVGLRVVERVVQESFWIAAGVIVLALLPVSSLPSGGIKKGAENE